MDAAGDNKRPERLRIKVRGVVQGVGFRPYVHGLAAECGLSGYVQNTSDGVTIEVEGAEAGEFVSRLSEEAPPLAGIAEVEVVPLPPLGYEEFRILESNEAGSFTLLSPDVSICDDCLAEMRDPGDRRHGYPFINCTNCGPRYSITRAVPYDRPNTTMSAFAMCSLCEREYRDPSDRRFHAVPNACPDCGPGVRLFRDGAEVSCADPVAEAATFLRGGSIVAVKGLGGFHLACDALNAGAVGRLRRLKRRSNKPFALMAPDVRAVKAFCHVTEYEEALLLSIKRPVVLLRKRPSRPLPEAIAPGNGRLGFMLPYTPLHYLLMEGFEALVMTSGNISDEPIQKDNAGAMRALSGIAGAFLVHDRDIFMRVDDSVLMASRTASPVFVRRARGFAPEPAALGDDGPDVFAAGADIKNTFTLLKGQYAIVSQHIGDMEHHETLRFFEETFDNLRAVYRAEPAAVAHDLHPGYFSTRWAVEWAKKHGLEALAIQHHHAHVASVMAENGIRRKVLGVSLDGTGYGPDDTLWGGEFLVADPLGYRRAGHFGYVSLPGGERAIREPWRTAASFIQQAAGGEAGEYLKRIGFFERFGEDRVGEVLKVCRMPEVSPLSSGAGRLLDAASSILGICDFNTFEGEAAMALEAAADGEGADRPYPVDVRFRDPVELDFSYTLICLINDMLSGVGREVMAARFQAAVAGAVCRVVEKLCSVLGIVEVALSGGVFQNGYLLYAVTDRLREAGLAAYSNRLVPPNDAGVSLGQAYVLRERLRAGPLP